MSDQTPLPGNGPALPAEVYERLAQFAEWTGTVPPETLLDEDGAPSLALCVYCRSQGLPLDWLFSGDVRGLAMRAHLAASKHILNTGFEEWGEGISWETQLADLLLRANQHERRIIKKAATDRLMGQPVGDVLWRMMAELDSSPQVNTKPKRKRVT